jgi:thiosulfate reductase cytochrome b subunit
MEAHMIAERNATTNDPLGGTRYYRHRLPVRISHWINVICLSILLFSGLGIFNAHPALYWGASSYSMRPTLLEITATTQPPINTGDAAGSDQSSRVTVESAGQRRGKLRVGDREVDTTGVLGVSTSFNGKVIERAFPSWLTIPGTYSLAESRLWHFFFAWVFVLNGLFYVFHSLISGHLRRDLMPDRKDMRGIGASIIDHLHFRHPQGEAAKRYNVLQKLAYLVVIGVLLPLIIVMGMAMSPMLDTVTTGWVDWFGGRQSARTLHFIIAWLLVAFVLIHVFEVVISGLWNHLRSMITGHYVISSHIKKDH